MNLQQANETLASIGRELCLEGMSSPSKEGDEIFLAVNNIFQAKRAIEKVIYERRARPTEEDIQKQRDRLNETWYGIPRPVYSGDNTALPTGDGMAGRESGALPVSGETPAHDKVD